MKTTTINTFWIQWQHGTDLQIRWIFTWFDINSIWMDMGVGWGHPNIFFTPISQTSALITDIVDQQPEQDLINFAWIQSTTPEHIRGESWMTNIHMMFGPNAQNNLKAVISGDMTSHTVAQILENCHHSNIRIIESDIETHDEMVSITQAFSHIMILLSGLWENKQLITEWQTPSQTIGDMITQNPESVKWVHRLMQELSLWDNITDIFMASVDTMSAQQARDFSTPSFERVRKFCEKNSIHINQDMLDIVSNMLDNNSLLSTIDTIKTQQ